MSFDFHLSEWLNYFIRLFHLVAGISWIGSSFYFMWLDSSFEPVPFSPEEVEGAKSALLRKNLLGEVWMTHGGNFYRVERWKANALNFPKRLHWFKYEALFTWISGMALLGVVYYLSHGVYLIDSTIKNLTLSEAMGLSVGSILFSWIFYDLLWQTVGKKHQRTALGLSLLLLGVCQSVYTEFLSGRAAFIHMGALMGTWMVANVWIRILPNQQKMLDSIVKGEEPDTSLGVRAKQRSTHNSYMTFPVLFMMLSNHYPLVYSGANRGVLLVAMIVLGVAVRHVMIGKGSSRIGAGMVGLVALGVLIGVSGNSQAPLLGSEIEGQKQPIPFAQVYPVIQSRCLPCHSTHPADATFGPSPGGVHFETPDQVKRYAERIRFRAVETKTMPLANRTLMTEEERGLLGRWIGQGAKLD